MLKKYGAIAMLLLMVVSFTIGSVSPVDVSSDKNGSATMYWRGMYGGIALPQFVNGALPPFNEGHVDNRYTSVILDLSGPGTMPGENYDWHTPEFMPPFRGIHMIPIKDYIDGKMIVRPAGSDAPSTFPVKFFRHQIPAMMGKASMVSYRANTTIELNDAKSSSLTFNGEILVVNDSIQYNNTIALPGEGYNSEITMGETVWHQAQVSGMSTAFNFDLKWNNPADDLRLMIYTPDGHVLGPYTDVSDGRTDGRINMEIDNQNGVADGTWLFKVTGMSVSGKDEYYIRAW